MTAPVINLSDFRPDDDALMLCDVASALTDTLSSGMAKDFYSVLMGVLAHYLGYMPNHEQQLALVSRCRVLVMPDKREIYQIDEVSLVEFHPIVVERNGNAMNATRYYRLLFKGHASSAGV